jgi:hypothetical protein
MTTARLCLLALLGGALPTATLALSDAARAMADRHRAAVFAVATATTRADLARLAECGRLPDRAAVLECVARIHAEPPR